MAHELGHAVAARLTGVRLEGVQVGAGPLLWQRGKWWVRLWPVGAGVLVDGASLGRLGVGGRLANHLAGVAVNALMMLGFLGVSESAALANAVLLVTNLLPLPMTDGGWAMTALMGLPLQKERAWHQRWAWPAWGVAVLAAVLGVLRMAA